MEYFDILMIAGKDVLMRLYEKNEYDPMDDAEYIPILKSVIEGIENSAKTLGLSDPERKKLSKSLKDFVRRLYIKVWLENLEEGEEEDLAEQEAKENFDYIFKHEEHP